MHSSLVRIQNVFGYFTTVTFVIAALVAVSSIFTPESPSASLELRNVQVVKGRPHYYSTKKEEYAHIKFDLSTDLSSLFTWNTKQVFVYVTATFPSQATKSDPSPPLAEAIIWDAIIPSRYAAEHPNTYIHPSSKANKDAKARKVKSPKSKVDEKKPYPAGKEEGILELANQKPKYQITTPGSKIAGLEGATLHLRYNVQPWVGALTWSTWPVRGWRTPFWKKMDGGESHGFDMPLLKAKSDAKGEELGTEKGAEAHRLMAG